MMTLQPILQLYHMPGATVTAYSSIICIRKILLCLLLFSGNLCNCYGEEILRMMWSVLQKLLASALQAIIMNCP